MTYSLEVKDKYLLISLSDSIDLSVTNTFKEEFESLLSSDIKTVYVNAKNLRYIDSSGVASLLYMRKLCSRFGSGLVIQSISESAARVIQLANLDAVLRIPKIDPQSLLNSTSFSKNSNSRIEEPKFSDADAMTIFNMDLQKPVSMAAFESLDEGGTFNLKPPSFH